MPELRQVNLTVDQLPDKWYNIQADLPEPLPPPQDPEKGESRIAKLPKMMIGECLRQEFSTERWIPIPDEVRS